MRKHLIAPAVPLLTSCSLRHENMGKSLEGHCHGEVP